MTSATESSHTSNTVRYEFLESDDHSRGTVLLLPGLFAGGWMWDGILADIRNEGWSIIRVQDALSELEIEPPLLEHASDILTSLTELPGNREVVVIANSLGGLLALEVGLRCKRVSRIVLSGCPGLSGVISLGLKRTRDLDEAAAWKLAERLYFDPSKIDPAIVARCHSLITNRRSGTRLMKWLIGTRNYPLQDRLETYQGKIHLIWGEHDQITPVSPWIPLSEQLNQCSLEMIGKSGHSPMVESPEEFGRILIRVLRNSFEAPEVTTLPQ